MTYAIQQFHATHYTTVAEAGTLRAAFAAAGSIKRKAPELPVRIVQIEFTNTKTTPQRERKTTTAKPVG